MKTERISFLWRLVRGKRALRAVSFIELFAVLLLTGCGTIQPGAERRTPAVMEQIMERKNRIVLLSGERLDPDHPTLLLLHGATADPTEMLAIADQWGESKNVFLYSYNFHEPAEKLAADLVREMERIKAMTEKLAKPGSPGRRTTVIVYSYSAIVFRESVLLAGDKTLFSEMSLIQLVPTAGGSNLARSLGNPVAAFLVSLASMPSTAQNPYGKMAKQLWGRQGSELFDAAISPDRVQTFLVDPDLHSLAHISDPEVRARYQSGIGTNVVTLPKESGVTHDNFPNHPVALEYLQRTLEPNARVPLPRQLSQTARHFDKVKNP